jgi:xylose isomerase
MLKARYGGWDNGIGKKIEKGKVNFGQLEQYTFKNGEPKLQSGRQELLENLLNEYI